MAPGCLTMVMYLSFFFVEDRIGNVAQNLRLLG